MREAADVEKANREAILKQTMEDEHRAADYGEALFTVQQLLERGRQLLDLLKVPDRLSDKYDEDHGRFTLKPPKQASDEDVADLKDRVVALSEVVEKLTFHYESDGLILTIFHLFGQDPGSSWPLHS